MRYAMRYAEESRARIYESSLQALRETFGALDVTERIETHHNFAAVESHGGDDLLVPRKGAVRSTGACSAGGLPAIPRSIPTGGYNRRGQAPHDAVVTCPPRRR